MDRELEILIKSAKNRDEKAYSKIYDKYMNSVYITCAFTLDDKQDVQKAVSDTFVYLYESLNTLSDVNLFDIWIQKIAVYECGLILQNRGVNIYSVNDYHNSSFSEDELTLPGEYLEKIENFKVLKSVISVLPIRQKQALVLNIYDGMNSYEIASVMDCSEYESDMLLSSAKAGIIYQLQESESFSGKPFARPPVLFNILFNRIVSENLPDNKQSSYIYNSVFNGIAYSEPFVSQNTDSSVSSYDKRNKKGPGLAVKIAIAAGIAALIVCIIIAADILFFS